MQTLRPCGYFVLVDITKAESVTSGGIVLPNELVEKEQMAEETGIVVSIGPTAFVGMRGCEAPTPSPAEQWGIKPGDTVEFKRFEGKKSYVKGKENLRYIPDTHIMGVIENG